MIQNEAGFYFQKIISTDVYDMLGNSDWIAEITID